MVEKGIINSLDKRVIKMYSSTIKEGLEICREIESMCGSIINCGYKEIATAYYQICHDYRVWVNEVSKTPVDIILEDGEK